MPRAVDRWFAPGLTNATFGAFPTMQIGATGSGRFCFRADPRWTGAVFAELVGICSATAAGPGKDLDLRIEHGTIGEASTAHLVIDSATLYDWSGAAGKISIIADLAPLLGDVEPGEYVGIQVQHNGIGGPIDYLGVRVCCSIY